MDMLFCLINFYLAGNLAFINAQVPGGISTTTLKNIEKSKEDAKLFKFLLKKAIQNYNRASNSLFLYNIIKIDEDHIKTQVVNGIKYIVEAELALTMCRKRANDVEETMWKVEECPFQDNGNHARVELTMISHPWEEEKYETYFKVHRD